jgi:bacillithiol system protein YtxJ
LVQKYKNFSLIVAFIPAIRFRNFTVVSIKRCSFEKNIKVIMSFFNSIFGASDSDSQPANINWTQLTDLGQLNDISSLSFDKPVLIFKHSTRCSISRMALKQFENEFNLADQVIPYFLDLLEYRPISNEIASRFQVVHQSPQLILIKDGNAIYDVSHSDIQVDELAKQV